MPKYDLVADVGATNARFALTFGNSLDLLHIKVLACANYPSLESAVSAYLASIDQDHEGEGAFITRPA